ncbi:ComF family protein [Fructilactobacillus myrtifloralis]|uniref:ComF family protein n=1 Tax=Fructilactobacillus myrtifloralis TaxID=2940301 RepID=A0ABY5BPS3_9LACO|nr:phosphoribosyltransferase family protein [Fructilactobacillus myrtifloralis]USS84951.1 ComF family protein [Fructilactobacillus myrtifloralis]
MLSFRPYQAPELCAKCERLFARPTGPQCPQCGRFQATTSRCRDCQEWNRREAVPLVNQALYPYHGLMQTYLERYKFQGDYALRSLVKAALVQACQREQELIVPVPLAPKQLALRKFNQVTGWLTDVAFVPALTAKPKLVSQHQQTRRQRLADWQPFALNPNTKAQLSGARVCLVDDVYTTGQTLHQAQRLLLAVGVRQVRSVTVAR